MESEVEVELHPGVQVVAAPPQSQAPAAPDERAKVGEPTSAEPLHLLQDKPAEDDKEDEGVPLSQPPPSQPKSQLSQRPQGFQPPVAKRAPKLADKGADLSRQDVMCPICWTILIEPTTLPCNHSLCTACFLQHVDETSLCCPCCRRRVSVWSRKAKRKKELLDQELWALIKQLFPELVEAKLKGMDSPNNSPTSSAHFESLSQISAAGEACCSSSQKVVRDAVLNVPRGEIFKELKELMVPHEKDIESQRLQEEAATVDFIQKMQMEEDVQPQAPPVSLNNEEEDYLLALKLQQEWGNEGIPLKATRLSVGVVKSLAHCRNLSEDFDTCLTPSEDEAPSTPEIKLKRKRKPRPKKSHSKKASPAEDINPKASKKAKPSATLTSGSASEQSNDMAAALTEDGATAEADCPIEPDEVVAEERFTFSPFSIKLRLHTQDYIPDSAEKKQALPKLSSQTENDNDGVLVGEDEYFYLEKEARMLETMRKKVEQEEADREMAEMLQKSYNMGIDNPRGRRCSDEYSLRSWRKNKK